MCNKFFSAKKRFFNGSHKFKIEMKFLTEEIQFIGFKLGHFEIYNLLHKGDKLIFYLCGFDFNKK